MQIIWGYTPEDILTSNKIVGGEIIAVKQVFSALLFKEGVQGMCVNFVSVEKNAEVNIELFVDSEKVLEEKFSPAKAQEYYFKLVELIIPKLKIEIILHVVAGLVTLPLSSIGTGMGFQKTADDYQPTNHLALGLLVP